VNVFFRDHNIDPTVTVFQIDFLAVLPYFISALVESLEDLQILSKAGKIMRLVRVMRILRIFKLVTNLRIAVSTFSTNSCLVCWTKHDRNLSDNGRVTVPIHRAVDSETIGKKRRRKRDF
jgi:hypothetical protein